MARQVENYPQKGFVSYVRDNNGNIIHTIQARDAQDAVDQFVAFMNQSAK